MTRTEWLALAERCESAEGPDTELDAAIACAVHGWTQISEEIDPYGDVPMLIDRDGGGPMIPCEYTASIDAIVGLIEEWLPEWRVRWQTDGDGVHEAFLENKGDFGAIDARHTLSFGINAALALCAAFCHAKAERAET